MTESDDFQGDDLSEDLSEELSDLDSIPSWIDDGETDGGEAQAEPPLSSHVGADKAKTADLEKERDAYMESLKRLQADFENYKKRIARDQEDYAEQKSLKLVEDLLPVVDTFFLALNASHKEDADIETLQKGIELVAAELFGVLEKQGLERIESQNAVFDPELHDAVMHEETGEHDEEVVVEVLREGYKVRGKVIRPAMVKVAK